MRLPPTISRLVTTVLLLGGMGAWAQTYQGYFDSLQAEEERWRINGNLGISYSRSSQSLFAQGSESGSANYTPILDLTLNTSGYLLDPKFLRISGGFTYGRGFTASDGGTMSNQGITYAGQALFLPRSHVPLSVGYAHSGLGVKGFGLQQDFTSSNLDVGWREFFPSLPQVTVRYNRSSRTTSSPGSIGDVSSSGQTFNVGVSDTWRQWHWNAGFGLGRGTSGSLNNITPGIHLTSASKLFGAGVSRDFWESKGSFSAGVNWGTHSNNFDHSRETGRSVGADTAVTLHPISRLSTITKYSFSRSSFDVEGTEAVPGVQVLVPLSSTFHVLSGSASYAVTDWLHVSEGVGYTRLIPQHPNGEFPDRTLAATTALTANRRWHGVSLSASGGRTYSSLETNFGHSTSTWSSTFGGNASWGAPDRLMINGGFQWNRSDLTSIIGGFAANRRLYVQASTRMLRGWGFSGNFGKGHVEVLSVAGDIVTDATEFGVNIDCRKFTLSYQHGLNSGANALFPLGPSPVPVTNLPADKLLLTPLLNHTTMSDSISIAARLKPRLELGGNWRREHDDLLRAGLQDYRVAEIRARYLLGKMTFEAGFGNYFTNIDFLRGTSRTTLNRVYFRIAREFTVF